MVWLSVRENISNMISPAVTCMQKIISFYKSKKRSTLFHPHFGPAIFTGFHKKGQAHHHACPFPLIVTLNVYKVLRKPTNSFFSWAVRLSPWIRLKNSTVSALDITHSRYGGQPVFRLCGLIKRTTCISQVIRGTRKGRPGDQSSTLFQWTQFAG